MNSASDENANSGETPRRITSRDGSEPINSEDGGERVESEGHESGDEEVEKDQDKFEYCGKNQDCHNKKPNS